MFTAHQIQILRDLIEGAQLANLQGEFFVAKDQQLSNDLGDIESILDNIEAGQYDV